LSASKIIIPKSPLEEFVEKIDKLNGMPEYEVFHHFIVVAKYIRTHIGTSGKLITAAQTQKEDEYQGKVGRVVKIGPGAFEDQGEFNFRGVKVQVGDWVTYRMSDGIDFDYCPKGSTERIHMRMLEDSHIKGRVSDPDCIY
jgi:co-chaperonin GroES (HSP10)